MGNEIPSIEEFESKEQEINKEVLVLKKNFSLIKERDRRSRIVGAIFIGMYLLDLKKSVLEFETKWAVLGIVTHAGLLGLVSISSYYDSKKIKQQIKEANSSLEKLKDNINN